MKPRLMVSVLVMVGACAQAGCSFLLLEGPPRRTEIPYRRSDNSLCTENNRAPVTDLILAGAIPLGGLSMAVGQGQQGNETAVTVILASALVLSGLEVVSAIWGFRTTAQCRRYALQFNLGEGS